MAEKVCPMTDFDTLLLAMDGSERNEGAIREAINLARGCASKLYALSVVDVNEEYMALAPEKVDELEQQARDSLDAIKAQAERADVDCEELVHVGLKPYEAIVDEADRNDADMIIMGRRGHTGVRKLVMGSVTARVIGHTSRKVLVVPRDAVFECRNILVATDGSADSEAAAIEAINLAKRCKGALTTVSVHSSGSDRQIAEENTAKVKELAASQDLEVSSLVVQGSPAEAITKSAADIGADLIVVGSHGRTGLSRLLMGSVTEGIIGHSDCSVLVAHAGV